MPLNTGRKLANSANTNCRPFQVKINCSKFIMIDFSNRVTYDFVIVSLLLASRDLLLVVFLPRKVLAMLQKIAINFRNVLLTVVLLLVIILEYFGKILQKYL